METLFVFLIICFFGFLFINSNLKDVTHTNDTNLF